MKNIIKYTFGITLIVIALASCKKDSFTNFEGEYTLKSSGKLNYTIGDTTFTDEPGLTIIKKGDEKDELFIYAETGFVTNVAPLGVHAKAKIDGNKYTLEERNLKISINLGGIPLSLPFTVNATGELSEDKKTLTSEVTFTGGIKGTITTVGTKK